MRIISPDYERAATIFKRSLLVLAIVFPAPFAFAAGKKAADPSCEEILSSLATISFDSVYEETERHPALPQLNSIYKSRSPAEQAAIDARLTENHLRKEMSFQTRNPATGRYDRFVAVPVNGHIAPIVKSDYDRMVRSTGPVLRALRSLLQKAYSHKDWSAESLGLSALPPQEAEVVLKVLRESIYMEPVFVAPQMAEYPFLAVSGFDGAIVDPKKPQNVFFEMNLGTPSGMSNNAELLEDLRASDPEVFRAVEAYLPADKSFSILRDTIERNARAWTHNSGISVVISPGVFNGAHPDVANIAKRAGMPLVLSSDLYEDANGDIRLNTGRRGFDPVVTGIYNRMEESFFFQSSAEGIPLINPQYENGPLDLRPGAVYKWIRDERGDIVGVERGEDGKPLLEEIWDTIGADPARPDAPRGVFARAVLNRKLYVSNLGGRLVDDKRLFRIVSEYMSEKIPGGVAHPVRGLSPDRIEELFRDPDRYVIKDPANSGGVGIHFPRVMNAAEKAALLKKVRANPGHYEVQLVSPLATLPSADEKSFAESAIDLRIFVMMDEAGQVSAGSNSILLRTAPRGKLYSNTSRGGGYGIGVVMQPKAAAWRPERRHPNSYRPHAMSDFAAAKSAVESLRGLYDAMLGLDGEAPSKEALKALKEQALAASFELRALMPEIEGPVLELPSRLRDFSQKDGAAVASVRDLIRALERAFQDLRYGDGPLASALTELRARDADWSDRLRRRLEDPTSTAYSPLNARIKYRPLPDPVVAYSRKSGADTVEKFEMAEILEADEPFIQKIIDDVRANEGEVRLMKARILTGPDRIFVGWRYESPYFWVNLNPQSPSYLKPVIGIDLTADRGLAALAHEYEHFKIWLEAFKAHLEAGASREAAAADAVAYVWRQDMIVHGERKAVEAEMRAERDFAGNPFNRSRGLQRPRNFWEKGYVNRITYPEFEALRQVLYAHVENKSELDMPNLRKYMVLLIEKALEIRAQALEHLGPAGDPALRDYWERTSLSDLLTHPYGIERLEQQKTLELFNKHLKEICKEVAGPKARCD